MPTLVKAKAAQLQKGATAVSRTASRTNSNPPLSPSIKWIGTSSRRGSLEFDQEHKKVTSAAWTEYLRNQKIEMIFHAYGDGALRRVPARDPSFGPPRFRVGDMSPYNSDEDEEDEEDDYRAAGSSPPAPNLAQRSKAAPRLPDPAPEHYDAPPTSILLQELLSAAKEEKAEWFDYEPNSNVWTPKPVKLTKASIGRGPVPSHVCVREFSSNR